MKFLTAIIGSLLLTLSISAQNSALIKKANDLLDKRGEIYFSFLRPSSDVLQQVSRILSIDKLKSDTVFAYSNRKEFNEFLAFGLDIELLTPPSEIQQVQMADNTAQVLEWNYYPTYPQYESIMSQFASDHPDICQLITLTTLASGRKILVLKITDNPDLQENEPEFLYTSSIHGDETTGYPMMLHLIDYLLTNYGTDARVTNLVNSIEIYINPLANPDGTYRGGNSSVNGAIRGNANFIDLNRNFPDAKYGPHPDNNPWQPETMAFMSFASAHTLTMSANFHGGAEVVNYPWDIFQQLHADNDWMFYISREYADTVHQNAPASYMTFMNNGITNGYAWYSISGGRQDYTTYFKKGRETTIELSNTKLIPENQILNHWNYNWRSLLNYLQQCTYGLKGVVTDSITGEPLLARIFIAGHDFDSSMVWTDPDVGDYHRLLKAGTYSVTYSASGYYPKTYTVTIADKQKTIRDVQLYNGRLAANFSADTAIIPVDGIVHFTDQSAGSPQSWLWEFEHGTPSVSAEQNPVVTYSQPGKYNVKLTVTRPGSTDSTRKNDYIEVKPWYLMNTKAYTLCSGLFMDSGGQQGNYQPNENAVITFIPEIPSMHMKATFSHFDLEPDSHCTNDRLSAFDGLSVSDPLIGSWCGSELPPSIISSNSHNALTFRFESNETDNRSGWTATLECTSNLGMDAEESAVISIFPNPGKDGFFTIQSRLKIGEVKVLDMTGKEVYRAFPASNNYFSQNSLAQGVYNVVITTEGKRFFRTLIVQ